MQTRIETISKGIIRVRRSEDFKETWLERYKILNAQPEEGADAGFTVTEHAVTLPSGRVLPMSIWTDAQDKAWNDRLNALLEHYADKKLGKRIIIGDPGEHRQSAPEAPERTDHTPFGFSLGVNETERFYGLGEGNRTGLNLRGATCQNWVYYQFDEAPIPFFMSSEGWGVLINNDWKHFVDVAAERSDLVSVCGQDGETDVFILAGESMQDVLRLYSRLTGHNMLLPKWAYGLTYIAPIFADQYEVTNDARLFRSKHIPCDMISLEPGWMTKFYDHGTDKQWEITRFHMPHYRSRPHPESFVTALKRYGFKLKLWLCVDYDLTAEEERIVRGEDTCTPEAWFNHLRAFVQDGVDAFKLDPCEMVYEVHPGLNYANGSCDEQMHNLNQVLLGKQMYQGFVDETGRRPMHHYCGAYTGMQRWSAFTTGDNGGKQGALIWIMNMALSGMQNTSCDMNVHDAQAIHFGLLLPWGHLNSWYGFSQPWWAGDELEAVFTYYARLRYRLLPYIYSSAIEGHEEDLPMLRPMPIAFPECGETWDCVTQYMLGKWLMVTVFSDRVYLPEGRWEDFWTGRIYEGGQEISYTAPEGRGGGLFVKRGAIIPMWKDRDYVFQYDDSEIELAVYPEGKTEYTLREDDGLSLDYETKRSCHTHIVCDERDGETVLTIGRRDGDYQGKAERRLWKIGVHGVKTPVYVVLEDERDVFEIVGEEKR